MSAFNALNRTVLLCRDYVADDLSDDEIASAFHSSRILCVSDAANLSCHAGQTALVTLVSLLSRMGMQVGLRMPDLSILGNQAPFTGNSIRTALTEFSECLMPGATIVRADDSFSPDMVFVLGSTAVESSDVPLWRLSGTNWSGGLRAEEAADGKTWNEEWPVGGMIAALLAANEAFKAVIRRLDLRQRSDRVFFEPIRDCHWGFGEIPVPENALDLGRTDLVSAGAITQACLFALTRIPRVQMRGRTFDDDITDISNLNRNMLTLVADIGTAKVDVVSGRCGPGIFIEGVPHRFPGLDANAGLARRVLVGVDDIPSRWSAQRAAPEWVGVSGTSHFSVSSSAHLPGQPCSGCLHPTDDPDGANPIPTVSFVSFWAGLAMAVRLVREALGAAYPSDRQHLWLTPLRLDQPRAAMWLPVPAVRHCPVRCEASKLFANAA